MKLVLTTLLTLFLLASSLHPTVYASSLTDSEITALVDGDLKVASKTLAKELEKNPTSAELHRVAGDVYAVRAQGASVFSAPGLAKKILKSYKKAVELEPDNTEYRMSLLQFYLVAPGIVGGSEKRAKEQVSKIKAIDPVSGVLADSFVLLNDKDEEGLGALFAGLSPELSSHPRIKMAKANYLRNAGQYDDAYSLLDELAALPVDSLPQDQQRLPYLAMLQTGFLAGKSDAHQAVGIDAFNRYLTTAPDSYKLTSKKWVRLFLGKLYAKTGQNEQAKSMLLAAKKQANDDTLLDQINDALKELK